MTPDGLTAIGELRLTVTLEGVGTLLHLKGMRATSFCLLEKPSQFDFELDPAGGPVVMVAFQLERGPDE